MNLVKMQRGNRISDVHPDEVENFVSCGWALVVDEVPQIKQEAHKEVEVPAAKSYKGKRKRKLSLE